MAQKNDRISANKKPRMNESQKTKVLFLFWKRCCGVCIIWSHNVHIFVCWGIVGVDVIRRNLQRINRKQIVCVCWGTDRIMRKDRGNKLLICLIISFCFVELCVVVCWLCKKKLNNKFGIRHTHTHTQHGYTHTWKTEKAPENFPYGKGSFCFLNWAGKIEILIYRTGRNFHSLFFSFLNKDDRFLLKCVCVCVRVFFEQSKKNERVGALKKKSESRQRGNV